MKKLIAVLLSLIIMSAAAPVLGAEAEADFEIDATPVLTSEMYSYEEIEPGLYTQDGVLFVTMQTFEVQSYEMYDEETLKQRVEELEGEEIRDFKAEINEEYSALMTYPSWLVTYTKGENEDTVYCRDLIFQTDSAEYRAHLFVYADWYEDYENVIDAFYLTLELEDPRNVYFDYNNMVYMNYPVTFSGRGAWHNSGAVLFRSLIDDQLLVFGVPEDTDALVNLLDRIDITESKEVENGAMAAIGEEYDGDTEETSYIALFWADDASYYFGLDIELYPFAAVICGTEEEALSWYERIEYGDISFDSANGLDLYDPMIDELNPYLLENDSLGFDEHDAMSILADALYYRLEEGMTLLYTGEGEMDGVFCYNFALGTDSEEKFTAEEHYAVTSEGEIFEYNVINDTYEPFAFG